MAEGATHNAVGGQNSSTFYRPRENLFLICEFDAISGEGKLSTSFDVSTALSIASISLGCYNNVKEGQENVYFRFAF